MSNEVKESNELLSVEMLLKKGAQFYYMNREAKRINVIPYIKHGIFVICLCTDDGKEHTTTLSSLQYEFPSKQQLAPATNDNGKDSTTGCDSINGS